MPNQKAVGEATPDFGAFDLTIRDYVVLREVRKAQECFRGHLSQRTKFGMSSVDAAIAKLLQEKAIETNGTYGYVRTKWGDRLYEEGHYLLGLSNL